MASFYVRVNEAHAQADELGRYVNEISNAISAAEGIRNSLEIGQVYSRLQNVINDLYNEREKMSKMQGKLNVILDQYGNTELRIVNNVQSGAGSGTTATDGDGSGAGNGNPGTSADNTNPATGNNVSIAKTILKALFDMGAKGGSIGKSFSLFNELLKMAVDGDGFTVKDIGKLIKGTGTSAIGILDLIELCKGSDWQKMIGLNTYKGFPEELASGWFTRMKDTWGASIKKELSVFKNGTNKIDCPKIAGWALTLVANGFSNAEECQSGEISGERAVAETITETLIDIGKGAAITAGVAAGIAAIGVSAPAIVVAGAGVAISAGIDWVCKQFTGESLTETVSDFVLDSAEAIGETITGAISSAGEAISGWWDKVQLAW